MPPDNFEGMAKGAFDVIKRTLGTTAIYLPKTGGSFPIEGPFSDLVQEVDPDTEQPVSSNLFTFGLKLDDIPNPPVKGDKIKIKTTIYKVLDPQEDGVPDVSAVLILHKVGS